MKSELKKKMLQELAEAYFGPRRDLRVKNTQPVALPRSKMGS
jgi:hypothetical protein